MPKAKQQLLKLYYPFQIAITVIFGICVIPFVGVIYLNFLLFIPTIGFSICNLLASASNNDASKTKIWDIIILAMAVITIIPILGWFSACVGLGFSIAALLRFKKWQKRKWF